MIKKTRQRIRNKIRSKISGTSICPRLVVSRSNKFMYVQAIDDVNGHTLAASKGPDASEVGAEVAKKLIKSKITKVVFDRSGYIYHGRVKILADAARAEGLKF